MWRWWICFNVVATAATSQWGGTTSSPSPPSPTLWARHNRQRRSTSQSDVSGSHARDAYDRSVTTFDPTGRLLQVEYAREAASKSATAVVAALLYKETIYVAIATKQKRRRRNSLNAWQEQQQRLLRHYMQRIDSQLFMIPTGLAGDARWVASHLRTQAQVERFQHGEAWTVTQAATALSQIHHDLSHTPGARPLGTACWLLGLDGTKLRLLQCAPGSVPRDCWYGTFGGPYEHAIVQGLHKLYRELCTSTCTKDNSSGNNDMDARIVQGLYETVVQGMSGRHSASLPSNSHNATKSDRANQNDDNDEPIVLNVYIIRSRSGTERGGRLSATCLTGLSSHTPASLDELRHCLNVRGTRAVDDL
jgi:20S proteasome alpha/beta subunit